MISGILVAVIPALLFPWLLLPLRSPLLFALLPVAPLAVVYARDIAALRGGRALLTALLWAAALSVSTVAATAHDPAAAMRGIWRADGYRDEMVRWIATGVGAEGSPAIFLPRLLGELAALLLLSAGSAGVLGLLLGSVLLGYMNAYVGWVVAHAAPGASPWLSGLLAWPPWAMARVAGFVLAGTAAASWGYPRIFERGRYRVCPRRLVMAAAILLLLDVGLKAWLAPVWREWLHQLLGTAVGIEAGGSG